MRKTITAAIAALLMITMTGCISPSSVDAGEEAVLVYKPWVFGHGGVDDTPVKTGLTWTVWSTSVKRVTVKPFNIDEKFDDLVTSDNNPVDFAIHMTFQHEAGKTPILVEKFGMSAAVRLEGGLVTATGGWYGSKVKEPLRNMVRSFTKSHKMFDMTTSAATTVELEQQITQQVETFLKAEGIPTMLVKATVGKVMAPQAVIDATIQTAVQKQNVKTQKERVMAEESREKAEVASANADKAYMKAIGMSPDQYLQMKELDNQKLAIEKGSNVSIIMGNAQPMYSIK